MQNNSHLEDANQHPEHVALLALSMIPGIGAGRIRQLVNETGAAQEVLASSKQILCKIKGIGEAVAEAIVRFDKMDVVLEQFVWAERANAAFIPYWDPQFPSLLDQIFDPPAFLWVRGELASLESRSLAIVGTRKPSAYGLRAATYFAEALVEQGYLIVSGLAYGIDAVAHRAALEAGGMSIGVLGSGIDRIYPAKHAALARSIVGHGALISELPLRAKPDAVNFPKRNRIISGLSLGTLVIEAFEKGGALITARLAVEQNREVFAVPGSMFGETSSGCHHLIREGQAKLVTSVEDILDELAGYGMQAGQSLSAKSTGNNGVSRRGPPIVNLDDLGAIERQLYAVLTDQPKHIDAICREAALDISTALVYLLGLEFKGLVFQLAGKQFYRA